MNKKLNEVIDQISAYENNEQITQQIERLIMRIDDLETKLASRCDMIEAQIKDDYLKNNADIDHLKNELPRLMKYQGKCLNYVYS